MILMSPAIHVGRTAEERAAFLRKVGVMDVKTVSMSTPADWSDAEVEEARQFLDDHGIRVGEFSGFHNGFGSEKVGDYQSALEHHRHQLRHAHILGAHCVGLAILDGGVWDEEFSKTFLERDETTPEMWSEGTWHRCIAATEDLVALAEKLQVDVAVHPHIVTPIGSVERYKALFEAVPSPRLKALMDPVNLTWPHMFFRTTELVNQIFDELSDKITALHAKDVTMSAVKPIGGPLSVVHLDEAVPGTGGMDYATILRRLGELEHDVTVWVEHFAYEDTITGYQYIRHVAREIGVTLH